MTEQELIDKGYKEGKKSFEYLVEEIFRGFNFGNVHKAMVAVGWNWCLGTDESGNDNMGIPDVDTIKRHAYRILKEAYEGGKQVSSGGFSAGWDNGELFLDFTLESYSA